MGADIKERLPRWKTGPVLREYPGYFLVPVADIDEAAAEIGRLRGEVERALAYLHPHLDAGTFAAPDWAIQLASILTGGDGCGTPAPAMPNGVEEMVAYLDNWLSREHGLNLGRVKVGDAVDAALRAADNRDAAGVECASICSAHQVDDPNCRNCNTKIEVTPAAVPAGKAVAVDTDVWTHALGWHKVRCIWQDGKVISTDVVYATPPAPVQAAPQEGEAVGEVVAFGSADLKEVAWRNGKMPPTGTKLYAHHSACELGAVLEVIDRRKAEAEKRSRADDGYTMGWSDGVAGFARELEAALQHRGDSRGGEVDRG